MWRLDLGFTTTGLGFGLDTIFGGVAGRGRVTGRPDGSGRETTRGAGFRSGFGLVVLRLDPRFGGLSAQAST